MAEGVSIPLDESPALPTHARPARADRAPVAIWISRIGWLAIRLVAILVAVCAFRQGVRIRTELWAKLAPIRFYGDIENTVRQGEAVIDEGVRLAGPRAEQPLSWPQFLRGYLHRYDTVFSNGRDDRYNLDYTPARLLIAGIWVRHLRADHPDRSDLIDADFVPLLNLNTCCELAAAIMMFLLVRHWLRRRFPSIRSPYQELRSAGGPALLTRTDQPWILGLLSASVFWFNPAMLVNAHGWPQWDVWLLPFFIGALWLASCEWWFTAGVLVAVAAMLKGQLLMVVPAMVLWPLLGGRIGATLRLIIGSLFAGALLTSAWLVAGGGLWVAGIVAATVALALLARRGDWIRAGIGGWISALAISLFIVAPWAQSGMFPPVFIVLPLVIAVLATPWIVRLLSKNGAAVWVALVTTWTICSASSAFSGTWSWLQVGFLFPTWHYPTLAHGRSQNIPALLEQLYQWKLYDHALTIDLGNPAFRWDLSIKMLLSGIYGLTLLMCGIAAAIHARRNDPRVLIALTAPWVLMYAICPQMHTRYLVWAAAAGSVGWAISVELALMNVLVTAMSLLLMLHSLLGYSDGARSSSPKLFEWMQGTYPGLSWMMALIGSIYLYQAMPRWRWRGAVNKAGTK